MRARGETMGLVVGARRIVAVVGQAQAMGQLGPMGSGTQPGAPRVLPVALETPLLPGTDAGTHLGPALRTLAARLASETSRSSRGEGGGIAPRGDAVSPGDGPPQGFRRGAPRPPLPVRVALLPPLVEVRFVSLPPLRPEEARMVLRRDVARHVPGMGGVTRGSVVVGVGPHQTRPDGTGGRMVAVASQGFAEALLSTLRVNGFEPRFLAPALAGWGVAGAGAGADLVAVEEEDTLYLAGVSEGRVASVRRLPRLRAKGAHPGLDPRAPSGSDPDLPLEADPHGGPGSLPLEEVGAPGGRVHLPGASPALLAAFREGGWVTLSGPAGAGGSVEGAAGPGAPPDPVPAAASAALAALFPEGGGTPDPEEALLLRPPSLEAARREREGRLALRLAGVALLLLVLAGTLHTLGAHADLRGVQDERRALAPRVAPVLLLRDSLDALDARLASLAAAEARLPAWGFPLVELATLLPPETHLTGLRLAGDTLAFDAEGGRAGDALAALRESHSFREPRVEGTIQRVLESPAAASPTGSEGDPGARARERFTLSALLVRRSEPRALPEGVPEVESEADPSPGTPSDPEPASAPEASSMEGPEGEGGPPPGPRPAPGGAP